MHEVVEKHAPHLLQEPDRLVLLSDRQKGLLEGVERIFPDSPHGYCLRHLEDNFHREFKNVELKSLLWKAARALTEDDFNKALDGMKTINPRSVPWLLSHANPEHWAELYFKGRRYGHLTSNIAESLNAWLLPAREMPILPLLERIRQQLMEWFSARRQIDANATGIVVSKVGKQIQTLVNDRARRYKFLQSTNALFEVRSKETLCEYIVNFDTQSCSCREWQATGVPCGHALAIIIGYFRQDPQTYAKKFYTLEAFRNTYAMPIVHPRNDDFYQPLRLQYARSPTPPDDEDSESSIESSAESSAEPDTLLPPNARRPPGRPKKRRIRSKSGEGNRRIQRCSRCRQMGHSKRTCREAI